jgi:hypothetical protein
MNSPEATGIELFVLDDISDLSIYGVGSINNPNVSDGQNFFQSPEAGGDYIPLPLSETAFTDFSV